jgi:hypothetical protein
MVTTEGGGVYPKAYHRHVFLSSELSVDALPSGFLSQNTKGQSWQPRGVPREEEGVRK